MALLFLVIFFRLDFPKKRFSKVKPTNILITGGVQGLGKLLTMEFAKQHPNGEINLIVLDIAEHLKDDLMKETQRFVGNPKFQHLFFYKINLAVSDDIEKLWEKIV